MNDRFEPMSAVVDDQSVSAVAAKPLHSIGGIVLATFFGGPFGGSVAMALNYSRLKSPAAARLSWITGLVASTAYFFAITTIPDKILDSLPNLIFIIPQLIAVYLAANHFQSAQIVEHERAGGAIASGWRSCGVGLLSLPVSLAVFFGVVFLAFPAPGTLFQSGNDELFYTGDATVDDAKRLAEALKEVGYFGGDGVSVDLSESEGHQTVTFVVQDGAWNDNELIEAFQQIGLILLEHGFADPITIQLSDELVEVQKTLTVTRPPEETPPI